MLPLLDLHDLRRHHFHSSVSDDLKEKLMNRIENLKNIDPKNKDQIYKELLEKSFPVIKIPRLQPVVFSLLRNIGNFFIFHKFKINLFIILIYLYILI